MGGVVRLRDKQGLRQIWVPVDAVRMPCSLFWTLAHAWTIHWTQNTFEAQHAIHGEGSDGQQEAIDSARFRVGAAALRVDELGELKLTGAAHGLLPCPSCRSRGKAEARTSDMLGSFSSRSRSRARLIQVELNWKPRTPGRVVSFFS